MSSLYELTNDFETVMDMVYDSDVDIETLSNTLECIECEFEEKAEGYAKVMKHIDGDISAISTEIKRLEGKKCTLEKRKDFMKNNLKQAMIITGKTKFKTALFSFSVQKNGGKRPMDIYAVVPDEFTKTVVQPDNEKIRAALDNGQELNFAILQEQGEHLRIR